MFDNELQFWKTRAIKSIFVDTADHNYIVARWAFFHGLHRDFFWNGLHCVEKYLKAALVLNNHSVKTCRHDIGSMFDKLVCAAGEFLPPNFKGPNIAETNIFFEVDCLSEFLGRLDSFGCANNRYAYFSYGLTPYDVCFLDALVFSVRRLCVILDANSDQKRDGHDVTYREQLRADPAFQPYSKYPLMPPIDDAIRFSELEEALFRLNVAFIGPEKYRRGRLPGLHLTNSILSQLAEGSDSPVKTGRGKVKAETIRWLIENIQFDRDTACDLKNAAQKFDPSNT